MIPPPGLTIQEDCLMGTSNSFEQFFCRHPLGILTSLAHQGQLTKILLLSSVMLVVLALIIFLYLKTHQIFTKS